MIIHALPGRIRLRHLAPLESKELEQLRLSVCAVAPSAILTHTIRSNTTLIEFAEQGNTSDVLGLFRNTRCDRPSPRRECSLCRWPSMSVVKYGMTGSMIAALGLAAMRREGGHALAGGIFLAFLSRHLWVYRRRLWK